MHWCVNVEFFISFTLLLDRSHFWSTILIILCVWMYHRYILQYSGTKTYDPESVLLLGGSILNEEYTVLLLRGCTGRKLSYRASWMKDAGISSNLTGSSSLIPCVILYSFKITEKNPKESVEVEINTLFFFGPCMIFNLFVLFKKVSDAVEGIYIHKLCNINW